MKQSETLDDLGRGLRNLRISVTDRCNLRCSYCMPEKDYVWMPHKDILKYGQFTELVRAFVGLGVDRVRLTGGEPLLRKDLYRLVEQLSGIDGLRDISLTTNGVLLFERAQALRAAGLHRVTISLDTLQAERFRAFTGRDHLARILEGIEHAASAGFACIKINTVVMKGKNDDELDDLLAYGKQVGAEVRFIEYMDVGGATNWAESLVFSREEMLDRLARRGEVRTLPKRGAAPADRFMRDDGVTFGIISSTTEPFCGSCDRSRITADGMWYLCLYAREAALDFRSPLCAYASQEELREMIVTAWRSRQDRGAEERLALTARGPLAGVGELRDHPNLEMHRRGG